MNGCWIEFRDTDSVCWSFVDHRAFIECRSLDGYGYMQVSPPGTLTLCVKFDAVQEAIDMASRINDGRLQSRPYMTFILYPDMRESARKKVPWA